MGVRFRYDRILALPLFAKWHMSAVLFFGVGILVSIFVGQGKEMFQALAATCAAIGFCAWGSPLVRLFIKLSIVKIMLSIFHFLLFLVATALARTFVSAVLGLPAQDFDLTTAIITVIMYPPLWLMVAGIIGAASAVMQVFAMLVFSMSPWHWNKLEHDRIDLTVSLLVCNLAGAAVLVSSGWVLVHTTFEKLDKFTEPVRWIAFVADYQMAKEYPGIPNGKRVRLHENGVVSSAELRDGHIVIQVWERDK